MLAEHYIRQALEYEKYESVANAYSFLGQIALDQDQIRRAQNCFKQQGEYALLSHSPFIRSRALNNQAIVHFMNDQYEKALYLFQKTLKERKNQGFHFYTCESYMNLANFYFETDQISTAQLYIDSCIFIAEKQNLLLSHIEALELIYEYQKTKGVKEKMAFLKQKRKELIQQNKDQRRTLTSKEETKPESRKSYIYLSIFVFLGIVWWLYSKD
jgi:tetratricopeptide (TPR) repeat protein